MKKLTPEQRVEIFEVFIDCVKTALATSQGHLVNVRKFDEYLTALAEPEDESKYATMEEVFPEFTAEDEPVIEPKITQQDLINVRMACDNALMDNYKMGYDRCNIQRGTDEEIALRKWKEYEHWLGEWNGDEPAPQEHMTFEDWLFEDWLQEASDE